MGEQGHLTLVADDHVQGKVEVTIEQLEALLGTLKDGDVATAKMWLVAAIHQGKKDLRDGNKSVPHLR
jgi:hypothetical protein